MNEVYATTEPARSEIDKLDGPTVIEFGSPWCGYCRAAQPLLVSAFVGHPSVRHIKIADASGRPGTLARFSVEAMTVVDSSCSGAPFAVPATACNRAS